MATAELQRTAQPSRQAPARPLRPEDLEAIGAAASDWLYQFCSAEGRAKLLRERGFAVTVPH